MDNRHPLKVLGELSARWAKLSLSGFLPHLRRSFHAMCAHLELLIRWGLSDSLRCSIPFLEQGFEYTQVGTLRWGGPLWLVGWHLFPWFRDDQVSAGGLHTVLLRNDGNALCVGNNRCLWWFWYGWINMTICTYFYEDLDVEDAWWIFDVSLRCKWGVLFSFGRRIHILKSQLKTSA